LNINIDKDSNNNNKIIINDKKRNKKNNNSNKDINRINLKIFRKNLLKKTCNYYIIIYLLSYINKYNNYHLGFEDIFLDFLNNDKKTAYKKLHPLYISDIQKSYPYDDLPNEKIIKMFYENDRKVFNDIAFENIVNDYFDKFNTDIVDNVIRNIHDKNFIIREIPKLKENFNDKNINVNGLNSRLSEIMKLNLQHSNKAKNIKNKKYK
jgi:hypothetical protein